MAPRRQQTTVVIYSYNRGLIVTVVNETTTRKCPENSIVRLLTGDIFALESSRYCDMHGNRLSANKLRPIFTSARRILE